MKNKTIILEGVEYNLVPVKDEKDDTCTVTFYYACVSDCGYFEFNVLLNDDGEIWEDTQSITYYPEGTNNKNKVEYWDNPNFLRDILRDKKIHEYSEITWKPKYEQNLVNLLEEVHKKGWI